MKSIFFIVVILLSSLLCSSQYMETYPSSHPTRKVKFGLSLSLNKTNIITPSATSLLNNGKISDGYGYSIASFFIYQLTDAFHLKSLVSLAFYESKIIYNRISNGQIITDKYIFLFSPRYKKKAQSSRIY